MIPLTADSSVPAWPATVVQVAADAAEEIQRIHNVVTRSKIMMVDDEVLNLKAIEKSLRRNGYENFAWTTEASRVLSMLVDEQPDLLLLDIMMPLVNGLEILRRIRLQPEYRCLPVIVLTAYCDPETRHSALRAGCTDFLAKPVDPQELALRVRNVLVTKAYSDMLVRRAERLQSQVSAQAGELASAQREAQMRYLAGKAEIATDVLHNVGNALNSVNVGINVIAMSMHDSRLKSLKRAVNLLGEQGEHLARFLTRDERGRILPSYLTELTEALIAERDKIVEELDLLKKHVDHINAVVSTQQKYAKVCQVFEEFSLKELLGDVEELLGSTLAKSGIEIVREFREEPIVKSDRQRLLQVLLNLCKNAMDAVRQAHPTGQGQITVRLATRGTECALVQVSDNGIGIPAENLVKVFTHGFTTKKDGHGFGLHSCGNIMQEIGGTITVQSEGLGRGATFILEIPFQPRERSS